MPMNNQPTEPANPEHGLFPELGVDRRIDPMILWGTWPGNEPIEELMAMLD